MHSKLITMAAGLSDAELLRRVVLLAGREREATVELVGHLAELDARKLHIAEGYGSLFTYCTGALRLAEHAAYNRMEAARLSRRFPAILDLLADGSLEPQHGTVARTASAAGQLRNARGPGPGAEQARGRSAGCASSSAARRGGVGAPASCASANDPRADHLLTRWRPPPAYRSRREVRSQRKPGLGRGSRLARRLLLRDCVPRRSGPGHRPAIRSLAPERYRVQFTIGADTHEKLRRAQDLLRREIPDGDPGALFDRALTLLLEDVARKKLAAAGKAAPPPEGCELALATSRRAVKRAVWLRDGGQVWLRGAPMAGAAPSASSSSSITVSRMPSEARRRSPMSRCAVGLTTCTRRSWPSAPACLCRGCPGRSMSSGKRLGLLWPGSLVPGRRSSDWAGGE